MTDLNHRILIITIYFSALLIASSIGVGNEGKESAIILITLLTLAVMGVTMITSTDSNDKTRIIKQLVSHDDDLYARCNDGTVMRKVKQHKDKQTIKTGWIEIEEYPHLAEPEAN